VGGLPRQADSGAVYAPFRAIVAFPVRPAILVK
jgi:hypothetical protein